jgi:hypothetical protein
MQYAFAFVATSAVEVHVVRKYYIHCAVISSEQLFSPSTSLLYYSQSVQSSLLAGLARITSMMASRICGSHATLLSDMAS